MFPIRFSDFFIVEIKVPSVCRIIGIDVTVMPISKEIFSTNKWLDYDGVELEGKCMLFFLGVITRFYIYPWGRSGRGLSRNLTFQKIPIQG